MAAVWTGSMNSWYCRCPKVWFASSLLHTACHTAAFAVQLLSVFRPVHGKCSVSVHSNLPHRGQEEQCSCWIQPERP